MTISLSHFEGTINFYPQGVLMCMFITRLYCLPTYVIALLLCSLTSTCAKTFLTRWMIDIASKCWINEDNLLDLILTGIIITWIWVRTVFSNCSSRWVDREYVWQWSKLRKYNDRIPKCFFGLVERCSSQDQLLVKDVCSCYRNMWLRNFSLGIIDGNPFCSTILV